ncbi:hypothetical protein EXIGLDRAFT_840339 [Exidia glandulosa HHB12029]|uniref:Aminoglycoside phosphotransferase domain-containing protein n=1 Tax=Exidia glandulosa HHB12029 TaxID=1314781 RepID=A0A165EHR6_EXIGL|nr:hypothetical protein EXIGLDRAFT_840339 [Exidia glandulosa HHB12029]
MRPTLALYSRTLSASYESFFRYTGGRWLHDEERQLALRYQRFDVDALKQVVLDCTGADAVMDIRKLAEGRCNKAFLVQLKNSSSVIARIPTPISGPPHLVTASEVATMDFVRNRLELRQVPRVLAWCSRAAETPVGAEYIIMDQAVGVRLDTVWSGLSMLQKLHVVRQWVEFESPLVQAFSGTSAYGSLYYRTDVLAQKTREIVRDGGTDAEFVIGPSVEDRLWSKEDFRDTLDIDRGSWPDVASFLKSRVDLQRAWIRACASRPKHDTALSLPPQLQEPDAHLRLLDQYESVARYFIPKDDRLLRPTLAFTDSIPGNIFLSQEALARGEIELSSVIDWQHTALLPSYLQSRIPLFIDDSIPALDQDVDNLERERSRLRTMYHALYQDAGLDIVWAALLPLGGRTPMQRSLPLLASVCWNAGYTRLKRELITASRHWPAIVGADVPCPLTFSAEEISQHTADEEAYREGEEWRTYVQSEIGIQNDGWVDHEEYDRAVELNRGMRDLWLASLKDVEVEAGLNPAELWPYRDVL